MEPYLPPRVRLSLDKSTLLLHLQFLAHRRRRHLSLTSFIIQTFTQFQRNPADISNGLLVAIYNQMVAQSKNTSESIQPVDPKSNFNQSEADSDYDTAVFQNALLYTGLSLSIIVSMISLVAKLWLVSYSRQAFSVGSPYDRAMKRQEAYNGLLVWNIGG